MRQRLSRSDARVRRGPWEGSAGAHSAVRSPRTSVNELEVAAQHRRFAQFFLTPLGSVRLGIGHGTQQKIGRNLKAPGAQASWQRDQRQPIGLLSLNVARNPL